MNDCRAVRARLQELAAATAAGWPDEVAAHVSACERCAHALAVERLARGLVAAVAGDAALRPGFARRVMEAVSAGDPREEAGSSWRPAWVLLPAFGGVAAILFALFLPGAGGRPGATPWPGVVAPTSAAERLVFEPGPAPQELVLAALLEPGS